MVNTQTNIYKDIAKRTGGDIYVGVVGPVRSGKSTFIKRFMDSLVIPRITSDYSKERAIDELPQSAAGRTIMTTEPKFIPEEAVQIQLDDGASLNVRMIDCVGYIVPSSIGYIEDDQPRMVMTPWFDSEIPFNMAAEIGTRKVITDHSTIGLVVTTDGSISDIPRGEYEEAEERVISELKEINKPFVVLLNTTSPNSSSAKNLASELSQKYGVTVMPVDCTDLDEKEIKNILASVLYEFPVTEISFDMPKWVTTLNKDHWLRNDIFSAIKEKAEQVKKINDIKCIVNVLDENDYVQRADLCKIELGNGCAKICVEFENSLFYKILSEKTGIEVQSESGLLELILELSQIRKQYGKLKNALDEVNSTGYGIVMPDISELTLEEPEIMKQGGNYGINLKASAPSIHNECIKQKYEILQRWRTQWIHYKIQHRNIFNSLIAYQ